MKFNIITIFPEMFDTIKYSIIKRALEERKIDINTIYLRDFAVDSQKRVDDTPYRRWSSVWYLKQMYYGRAIESVENKNSKIIYLTPKGQTLNQTIVKELSKEEEITLVSGHYEGFDQRIFEEKPGLEISIGDYVLTGGELPAMVIIDAISRNIEGVINKESLEDTFSNNLIEYPQYTKPDEYNGRKVPDILKSGNHKKIAEWRRKESLKITKQRRPDLLKKANLTAEDKEYLNTLKS